MRRLIFLIACLAGPIRAQSTALTGGTLIDGRGGPPIRATVVFSDGRIIASGPAGSITVPPGSTVVDATGKYILPGFVDANIHLTQYNFAGVTWDDTAAVRDGVRGAIELARHGVTLARDTYGMLPFQAAIRSRVNSGG